MKKLEDYMPWHSEKICKAGYFKNEIPCGVKYEVAEEDLVYKPGWEYEDLGDIGFVCPGCGCFTQICNTQLPEVVINRVKAKHYNTHQPKPHQNFWQKLVRVFN